MNFFAAFRAFSWLSDSREPCGFIISANGRGRPQAGDAARAGSCSQSAGIGGRQAAQHAGQQSAEEAIAGARRVDDRARRLHHRDVDEFARPRAQIAPRMRRA